MQLEIWQSLDNLGYSNYSISSEGRICNNNTNKLLKLTLRPTGYVVISVINNNGKSRTEYMHKLVLLTFIGPPPNFGITCDHINRNKSDNALTNLR